MITSTAKVKDSKDLTFTVSITKSSDFDPRCDVCVMSYDYIVNVFRLLSSICIFSDHAAERVGMSPVVVLETVNYHTVIDYLVNLFYTSMQDAKIETIAVSDLEGDLIDVWTINENS